MLKSILLVVIVLVLGTLIPGSEAQCTAPRVRRAWRNLQRAEQELYVEAVLLLKTRGDYNNFVNMHTSTNTMQYAHGASGFLPWHRWFLWKFEEALRGLGPKYQCITVPYWDWEREASSRTRSSVFGDLFGTFFVTNNDDGVCVRDGKFRSWTTTENACLQRAFIETGPNSMGYAGESEVAGYITRLTQYGSEDGFRGTMEGLMHGAPHVWVGGNMGAMGSPNDPVFFLHHANVDRIWSLWQDCHDYDRVDYTTGIQNRVYPWFQTSNTVGLRDGPLDPMPYSFSNGNRDQRFYTNLPTGATTPLPIDMMRIMGNRRITSMAYSYDPADTLKGLLDRTGARCNWHWFVVPNAIIPAPTTPAPTTPTTPANPGNNGGNNGNSGNGNANVTNPVCGNGIVERGEECDEPNRNCGSCSNCKLLCGNGVVDCGEDCDDGNRLNGDSCPATCRRAHVWRRIRNDLTLKRDGTAATGFDEETEAYLNGEISWEDYLFKRSAEQAPKNTRKSAYAFILRASNSTDVDDKDDSDKNSTVFRRLQLKGNVGTPISGYLLFGKAPEAPKSWANPQMEKLGSSVCEHNPLTKFAHAKSKLQMLTYVEAEMEGCRKRATPKWIAMTRMNASAFQPPCKGAGCCKVADMISEKMVCDGGTVAIPSCNATSCTWIYDCGNATSTPDSDGNQTAKKPSPYRTYGALNSNGQAYVDTESASGNSNSGIPQAAKIGLGIGGALLVVVVVVVVIVLVNQEKRVESV